MNAKRIYFSIASVLLSTFFCTCTTPADNCPATPLNDKERLVVAIDIDMPGYYCLDGEGFGYCYDLLRAYAADLGLDLHVTTGASGSECAAMLNDGRADIVPCLTASADTSSERMLPVYETSYSILTTDKQARRLARGSAPFTPSLLNGKRVVISPGFRLTRDYDELMTSLTDDTQVYSSSQNSLEVASQIAKGAYDYFICEKSDARISSSMVKGISAVYDFTQPVTVGVTLSPAVTGLRTDFTEWLGDYRNSNEYAALHYLYFENGIISQMVGKTSGHKIPRGGISQYDAVMRAVCGSDGLDWRLLSAICYNESRFNADVVSHRGAKGLMQIMPAVARQFNVSPDEVMNPEVNIMLATKLIKEIEKSLKMPTTTSYDDRMSIILACYNGGIGHVQDARRLARKYGDDPNSWSSVSLYLRRKALPEYSSDAVVRCGAFRGGSQTAAFVDNVMGRYGLYCARTPR